MTNLAGLAILEESISAAWREREIASKQLFTCVCGRVRFADGPGLFAGTDREYYGLIKATCGRRLLGNTRKQWAYIYVLYSLDTPIIQILKDNKNYLKQRNQWSMFSAGDLLNSAVLDGWDLIL